MALSGHLSPDGFGMTNTGEPTGRRLGIEEALARQIDRITFYRSEGLEWEDALEAFRDMITGLEDDTFNEQWQNRTIRARMDKRGNVYYLPTNADLVASYRIILALLARRNLTFTSRVVSETPRISLDDIDQE